MLLADVAGTSRAVAAASGRLAKVALLAECLRRARIDEVAVAVAYLSGELPQGTVGVGWAALRSVPGPAEVPELELLEGDAALTRLKRTTGPGSAEARREMLGALFARETASEQAFLRGLLLGDLRQGALGGVMAEAAAKAGRAAARGVRRAAMPAGGPPPVASAGPAA